MMWNQICPYCGGEKLKLMTNQTAEKLKYPMDEAQQKEAWRDTLTHLGGEA